MPDKSEIIQAIREGRSAGATRQLVIGGMPVFVKTGPSSAYEMYAAEAEGLVELGAPGAIRVPSVVAYGEEDGLAFLATEWLDLARPDRRTEQRMGQQLAVLHRTTADQFGWHRDNTCGPTPQRNPWTDGWLEFFRDHRLAFQLELAARNGYGGALQEGGARLLEVLDRYFDGYEPEASLLHGDLWGGNWGSCDGEPVIFDPAVHYGDRESDLAMTRLFGGFGSVFYRAYEEAWPLAPGHRERCDLYQLYHVLNHVNLFGSSYLGQAQRLIDNLLER